MDIEIVIACDLDEGEAFAAWLRERGYQASVGNTTQTTMNGERNDEAINRLWEYYCVSDIAE